MADVVTMRLGSGGHVGYILLNRPKALNALTHEMCIDIQRALNAWEADNGVHFVLIEGEGERAFCAGGDIKSVVESQALQDGKAEAFWADEYRLNHHISTYSKPYIALMDGIVMGGGVGLSVHGSHLIVTEKTKFAMPETGIGFFPDVGGSWFLPRMPKRVGWYCGLTGSILNGGDAFQSNVGTHYVPSEKMEMLKSGLLAMAAELNSAEAVNGYLASFAEEPTETPIWQEADRIEKLFDAASLSECIAGIEGDDSDFASETLKVLASKSPTSLAVTFEQLKRGAAMPDLRAALEMEYRLVCRYFHHPDFREGVRAAVIDKDRNPQWAPSTLDEVDHEYVRNCFVPIGAGRELWD